MHALPDKSIQACITSPPYFGLRSYGAGEKEIGREQTPAEYIAKMVAVFSEVKRLLTDDGTLWLNLGDSYAGSGRRAWNASDERKVNVKEVYRPSNGCAFGSKEGHSGHTHGVKPPEGYKSKDMFLIPARVAIALQSDGWYLRAACPWVKRNGMPDSTKDRPTQCVETIFMFTKTDRCYYDYEAVRLQAKTGANGSRFDTGKTVAPHEGTVSTKPRAEDGKRARRTNDNFFESWQGLWPDENGEPLAFVVNTKGFKGAHFATFPPKLIEPCVLASTRAGDTILDTFGGSGTTGLVAQQHGRSAILLELNPEYAAMACQRCGVCEEEIA